MLRIIESTRSGAELSPSPIAIPVDSMKESPKKIKKIASLDLVFLYPSYAPSESDAATW